MSPPVNDNALLSGPTVVAVRKLEQTAAVGSLSSCDREKLGKHLLEQCLEMARELSVLQSDSMVRALRKAFDASLLLNEHYLPEELRKNLNGD